MEWNRSIYKKRNKQKQIKMWLKRKVVIPKKLRADIWLRKKLTVGILYKYTHVLLYTPIFWGTAVCFQYVQWLEFLFKILTQKIWKLAKNIATINSKQTSLFFASFLLYLANTCEKKFPQQLATCTRGPSFPKLKPAETANIIDRDLIISVQRPR